MVYWRGHDRYPVDLYVLTFIMQNIVGLFMMSSQYIRQMCTVDYFSESNMIYLFFEIDIVLIYALFKRNFIQINYYIVNNYNA